MSRIARVQSDSGFYHVMARGVNKQPIFEEGADYRRFLDVMAECKKDGGFRLHAYCLMENHVHLLIESLEMDAIVRLFRRLGGRYVVWFNKKYGRTGHLFQDRYTSEPVGDDAQFLSCVRYIVQNPVKAGLCQSPFEYGYSSAREYAERSADLTDVDLLVEMVGDCDLEAFLCEEPDRRYASIDSSGVRMSDAEARSVMKRVCGCDDCPQFQALDKGLRDEALARMGAAGVSIRQAARITGTGLGVVRRCFGRGVQNR